MKHKPGFTLYPNAMQEIAEASLSHVAFRLWFVLYRETWGWRDLKTGQPRRTARLSRSLLMRKTRIASHQAFYRARQELVDRGLITVDARNGANPLWTLVDPTMVEISQGPDHGRKQPPTMAESSHGTMAETSHHQRKIKEKRERKHDHQADVPAVPQGARTDDDDPRAFSFEKTDDEVVFRPDEFRLGMTRDEFRTWQWHDARTRLIELKMPAAEADRALAQREPFEVLYLADVAEDKGENPLKLLRHMLKQRQEVTLDENHHRPMEIPVRSIGWLPAWKFTTLASWFGSDKPMVVARELVGMHAVMDPDESTTSVEGWIGNPTLIEYYGEVRQMACEYGREVAIEAYREIRNVTSLAEYLARRQSTKAPREAATDAEKLARQEFNAKWRSRIKKHGFGVLGDFLAAIHRHGAAHVDELLERHQGDVLAAHAEIAADPQAESA